MKRTERSWEVTDGVLECLKRQNQGYVIKEQGDAETIKFVHTFRLTKDNISELLLYTQEECTFENIDGHLTIRRVKPDHTYVQTSKEKRQTKISMDELMKFVPLENLTDEYRVHVYKCLQVIFHSFGLIQVPKKYHFGTDVRFIIDRKSVV